MGLKLLKRGFVVVLACTTAVCILSAGCEKKKEEQAIPRAPVSPQATGQPPQAPEAPGLVSKAPGQPASPHGTMTPKSDKPVVVPDDVKKKCGHLRSVSFSPIIIHHILWCISLAPHSIVFFLYKRIFFC